jgi:5-bromo-4-chloroindolyl phosphate hydrolysis protein
MAKKTRKPVPHGEAHHRAKLTEKDIHYIREEVQNGTRGTINRLAKQFLISRIQVWRICNGDSWGHVKETE